MPTYSYRCTECGTAFDIQQAFTDDSLTECPTCNGRLRKLYSSVGVTFNGSGFYRTDSRPAEKSSSSSDSSSGSTGSGAPSSAGSGSGSGSSTPATSAPAPASSSSSKE